MTDIESSDFVEDAFALLRESFVPEGPSVELLSLTTERLRSMTTHQTECLPLSRRSMMFRMTWYGSVSAACTSILVAVVWIWRIDPSASIAFADVQEQAQKYRSVQYTEAAIVFDADGNPQKRNSSKSNGSGDTLKNNLNPSTRHYILGRDKERIEQLDSEGHVEIVTVTNLKEGKMVSLQQKAKTIRVTDLSKNEIELGEGKVLKFDSFKPASAGLYKELDEIPSAATTRLPARKIGDKQVVGFVWEKKDEQKTVNGTVTYNWKRIYWVEPATKLLVRMDCSMSSSDPAVKGRVEWMKSDFVFDTDLDQSLFSTATPEGYTIETGSSPFLFSPADAKEGNEGAFSIQVK